MPARSARRRLGLALGAAVLSAGLIAAPAGPSAADPLVTLAPVAGAPGAPGTLSRFDLARKDCVGTARTSVSKVWFTVAGGALSDVYEPTIDNTNVQSLQFVVTDGSTFTDLQQRDTTYTVQADDTGMACTVTSTSTHHGYRLVTTYLADPARDTVLIHTSLIGTANHLRHPLQVFARLDAHVNGNGGGGTANGGADDGAVASGVPVIGDSNTVSQATNRDYAVPTFMALDSPTLRSASVGYAGSASDGLIQLDGAHKLAPTYSTAPAGHVVATADVTPGKKAGGGITLALGFGRTQSQAVSTAAASLGSKFAKVQKAYARGWRDYDDGLTRPHVSQPALVHAYYVSANVLKASEDKTFPGALVASLASPWGQAVSAGDLPGGKPVYFGSYREVFARDLYEGFTGLIADGDLSTARAATKFLFDQQQGADGSLPRNSLLNGATAPDTGGNQLDETAYPILMTYLSGLGDDPHLYQDHVIPAADYLVAHGPSFGVERWEEQSGYSPSTIAAEIAGLAAAATIAQHFGDTTHARLYQAVADDFQRTVKAHTVTHNGPYSSDPYFIRLSKTGDPNAAFTYNLGNGSVDADQRAVVDGGFQELVRLGELPASDPDVVNSLTVLDQQDAVTTPTGTGYYRYGTSTTGSEDGYGDCYAPDPTSCTVTGQPWPTTGNGSGHLWPVLSGERGESALASGDSALASSQLAFMLGSASGEGLVPEQAWEDPSVAAAPYGADPTVASIGFTDGAAAGSASPLTWAQAQELRLIADIGAGRITDRPDITTARYVTHAPPAAVPVTISTPSAGQNVSGTTTVSGTTAAGAKVVVSSIGTDTAGATAVVATTAGLSGGYSVDVPVAFGTDVITVAATTATGTGTAQVSVLGDLVGGTTVLDVTDPANDDNGPGTYKYPTSSNFVDGSFDVTRFQVLTKDGVVYLRTTLRTLVDTFGEPLGAQLFDIYIHRPDPPSTTSQAAAADSRNYTIAAADAWSQRLEVQGFAGPVWVDPAGHQVGPVGAVVASTSAKTVTIALPEAQFGTPASGWSFVVALTGQDGFGADQARTFAATPQDFQFGVCAPGGSSPICSVDPNSVPKVMDTLTPAGVLQSVELNPTAGPVMLAGVPVS